MLNRSKYDALFGKRFGRRIATGIVWVGFGFIFEVEKDGKLLSKSIQQLCNCRTILSAFWLSPWSQHGLVEATFCLLFNFANNAASHGSNVYREIEGRASGKSRKKRSKTDGKRLKNEDANLMHFLLILA